MTSTDPTPPTTATKPEASPGEGRRAGRGHVLSYGGGRICIVTGCPTILSIYNDGSSCAGHRLIGDRAESADDDG